MITFSTQFFQPCSDWSAGFSKCYTKEWVEKLYCAVRRNVTRPFEFTCVVDKVYDFKAPIIQIISSRQGSFYAYNIEVFISFYNLANIIL